ncbi:hypothetical protein ACRAWF_31600 [Streptomyces sp. L7]
MGDDVVDVPGNPYTFLDLGPLGRLRRVVRRRLSRRFPHGRPRAHVAPQHQ